VLSCPSYIGLKCYRVQNIRSYRVIVSIISGLKIGDKALCFFGGRALFYVLEIEKGQVSVV